MANLDFSIMYESILNLFERDSSDRNFNCAHALGGNHINVMNNHCAYLLTIGEEDQENFYKLVQKELHSFLISGKFAEYFNTSDEKINKRRLTEYDKLITRKLCKRGPFKRNLMLFLDGELFACWNTEEKQYHEKYRDPRNRQKLMISAIKNYIHRTFYIYEYCSE